MHLELTRYYHSSVQTRGLLSVIDDGETVFQCYTLELPWKKNRNNVSCIPPAPGGKETYKVRHRAAEESGNLDYDHFILVDVEGRTYILIHIGNLFTDILGCILVGTEFVDINDDGHPDVVDSETALETLRSIVPEETEITIKSVDTEDLGPVPAQEPVFEDIEIDVPAELAG